MLTPIQIAYKAHVVEARFVNCDLTYSHLWKYHDPFKKVHPALNLDYPFDNIMTAFIHILCIAAINLDLFWVFLLAHFLFVPKFKKKVGWFLK